MKNSFLVQQLSHVFRSLVQNRDGLVIALAIVDSGGGNLAIGGIMTSELKHKNQVSDEFIIELVKMLNSDYEDVIDS
jgi:hypothetical protein